MPPEIDVKTVLEISNYIEKAERETPQEAYNFLREYYPNVDVADIVDIIKQKRGAEYLAQIEIIKRSKEKRDNNLGVKTSKLEKEVLNACVSEKPTNKQKKKSNKLKYFGIIGAFLAGGAILTSYYVKKDPADKFHPSIEQNTVSDTRQNLNDPSEKRKINYLGPNNSNICTLEVKPSQLYESANLELIINSNDSQVIEIQGKSYKLSPGKNKINVNKIEKGNLFIRSTENSQITLTPTKISCQNNETIKIKGDREVINPEQEIYAEKLPVNFKGRTMLFGNFGKEIEDSLNPLLRKFTFKNKEGRIYSFNVSNGEFNSFCRPEKLIFDKIYIERNGEIVESETKLTNNFILDMANYENKDIEESFNILLSDKKVPVTIKSGHPWQNPKIHLVSAKEKEYRITNKEAFNENIIFLNSEEKKKIKPGFYIASIEIPERQEWMGRKAVKATKRIIVIPGMENNFLIPESTFKEHPFYLDDISKLKELRDCSDKKQIFRDYGYIMFSKDTILCKNLNIDGNDIEIFANIPHYSVYKKWEEEGMKQSPARLIEKLEGRLKLDLKFTVNGRSVSEKIFCDGRASLEDLDLNQYSLKSDSLINLTNERYILEFKYIPFFRTKFKHWVGFLCNKAEGTLNSCTFKYELNLLKQKDIDILLKIEDNSYSINE